MIYVPILKTRKEEYRIAKNMNYCFSNKIIPMFEIISEQYEIKYLIDDLTGEFLYEKKGNKKYKIKKEEKPEDIITLQYINNLIDNKKVFIDYFRFSIEKYGRNIDVHQAELAINLSNDNAHYKKKVLSVSAFPNMIPVISIKKDFDFTSKELDYFLDELQIQNDNIALRITEAYMEKHRDLIKQKLRPTDYLLFDIEEQNPETKFMEIEELNELNLEAQIILINSPRKLSIRNGEYPEHEKTDLINNSARIMVSDNNLDGYGDYCGLKDKMPLNEGSNGTGAALALFFDFKENIFYSYSNHDTSLGTRGYYTLIPLIKNDKEILDPSNDCAGYKKFEDLKIVGIGIHGIISMQQDIYTKHIKIYNIKWGIVFLAYILYQDLFDF